MAVKSVPLRLNSNNLTLFVYSGFIKLLILHCRRQNSLDHFMVLFRRRLSDKDNQYKVIPEQCHIRNQSGRQK